MECDRFDRHGVLRCPHCGGPAETRGDGLGFYTDGRGTRRVRGACTQRNTPQCRKLFSVRCDAEPRLIGPYNLLDATYHEVREAHSNFERTHHHQRTRYATGGQEVLTRAHRVGVAWQMLRCSAAMFLEWFRLCVRHGWLASPRAPKTKRNAIRHFLMGDGNRLKNVTAARRSLRLQLPYGAAAIAAGLGRHGPPGQARP